ncbi:uncharacterized protein C8Q71DRAFT_888932 [Rhodofomes roseus]|uniref:CxC2-like cysteine cluster KDZ transposase-associated domain-containing protein n=1 Tax=Rhodofomes roseus TaxID=34475 RepID=A0ABQ8JYT4_9APHY|nr:uncharacterized protein C8Q71DRAFT_888932 [Rhodofomes roseus]KAH9829413.1 hypothetical protein C8Q71DRAFT_888932 [Rhodofomes roseus]
MDLNDAPDEPFETMEMEFFHDLADYVDAHKKRKRTAGDNPLREWTPHTDDWLAELLRLEGRCGYSETDCAGCGSEQSPFRCRDCFDVRMWCETCVLERHQDLPFHRLETWQDSLYFVKVDLKSLGLRIQLGHPSGERCTNPKRAFGDDFVVLDLSGIHQVALDFCGCTQALSRPTQLLRARLFPATPTNPKTAATFTLLRHFHLLSNQANVSGFEFHTTLARLTDNTGLDPPPDRYPSLMRMMRMWRNLRMFKRAGRGHDAAGVKATAPGECAVICPVCPHPGKNLPEDWKSAPPERQWLYRLFIGIDANFRLKRRAVSSNDRDPGLNHGYAYFVEETGYKDHLRKYSDLVQETTSTCSNHDAVRLVNSKGRETTDATGIVTIECTRHDMKRPCAVGDLQKGERYVNTDYIFQSSLKGSDHVVLVVSYDIACQWSVHFWERMNKYDPQWDAAGRRFIFLIPKFHLPAHQASCREDYSFNYTKYVGRTDGEAVERGWSAVNGFSGSTRDMGPGARRDMLDDVFADYNWRKITRLPNSILTKVKNIVELRSNQVLAFQAYDEKVDPALKAAWTTQVEAWEASDGASPNPFAVTRRPITMAAVRLKLAELEADELKARTQRRDQNAAPHATLDDLISPYALISQGLEHEEEQRRLKEKKADLGSRATDLQKGNVVVARNALHRTIEAWQAVQHLYMPTVAAHRSRDASRSTASSLAEDLPLYLPSNVIELLMPVDRKLQDIEWELRVGLAHDALEDIRRLICVKRKLLEVKGRFISGQHHNTRARGVITRCDKKITQARAKYHACYEALVRLAPALDKTHWRRDTGLQKLDDNDVRHMSEPDPTKEDEQTEGTRTISWIWTTKGARSGDDDEDEQEMLRIEWCQARARAHRFTEEGQLLEEEMRRVVQFYEWQASWWRARMDSWEGRSAEHREGLVAYARRQADLRVSMKALCQKAWASGPFWLSQGARL